MRADRLLSILMLLQDRGRLTARELADELEVSERTIYRDMVALSTAGVPVYAERGPGGGCSLIDNYRTNLTGLTRHEVRALFMLNVPAPLAELGVDHDLKTALLKLSAALPDVYRLESMRARERIHLDSSIWFHELQQPPNIGTIQHGLWNDRKIRLTYLLAFGAQVEHLVEPYGLVAKSNLWYLVFCRDGDLFVQRLDKVLDAELTNETFAMPPDFDLVKFWTDWCAQYENNRPYYPVRVRVKADVLKYLQWAQDPILQDDLNSAEKDQQGWIITTLHFEIFEEARKRLLNFGGAVEVLEPEALRRSIQDFAHQINSIYQP